MKTKRQHNEDEQASRSARRLSRRLLLAGGGIASGCFTACDETDPVSAGSAGPAPSGSSQPPSSSTSIDDAPAVELPPAPVGPANRTDAVRFLNQTSFGASKADIDALVGLGSYEEWVDQQLAVEPSLTEPYVVANSNGSLGTTRHYIWWTNAMEGQDQFRQRLAFAWSQIFVVSDRDYTLSNAQYAMCNFYDLLAIGATGNFRDLLEQITVHPVMGIYLSMVRNERADPTRNIRPDENFARELMQLFTIGLHELTADGRVVVENGEPVPAYEQRTVEEFARVWTGWNFGDADEWFSGGQTPYDKRIDMVPWEEYHEPAAKELLGGVSTSAGATTRADMSVALDNLFNHPNVGPFLARLLIQRLVTSNPTPAYVGRVASAFNDDGTGVRGSLAAVAKAVVLDAEARLGHGALPQQFGKFKEPTLRLTQLWRAFDVAEGPEATTGYRPYARPVDQLEQVLGMGVMRSPSVFNFYLPDSPLSPGSELVAPERSILSEINVASTNNMLFAQVQGHHHLTTDRPTISRINLADEVAMAADPVALVAHLDELLLASTLPAELGAALISHLETFPSDEDGRLARTVDAVYALVGSPLHLVQA